MTEFISWHADNPPPAHISRLRVPAGEWVDVPGFDPTRTLRVRHDDLEARLLLLERPGKVTWWPAPTVWSSKVDNGKPTDHTGAAGLKMTFGGEPDGHAHSGPGKCPAPDCKWKP